jgi:hypothetical protein
MRNFSSISKRDQEEFGGTKGVIRIRKSKDKKTQWPKEKGQKDKQRSTKHTHKTEDRVTRTPLRTGGELWCYGKVSSTSCTSDTRRVNIFTNSGSIGGVWTYKRDNQKP